MIKKILKILGIIIVLILGILVSLPIIFKDDIIQMVKDETNNNVNAKVEFGDFDLSIISSFPDFKFSIEDISVVGIDDFDGVKLAGIDQLELTVDLMSIIEGTNLKVKTIGIHGPEINVIVLKGGKANYDIAKASEDSLEVEEPMEVEVAEEPDTSAPYSLSLKNFEITNAHIVYDDRDGGMYAGIENLNFSLKGDLAEARTALETKTTIDALTYKMDGISYLKKAALELILNADADMENMKFTLTDNSFRINQLAMFINGWFQMLEDESYDMDLSIGVSETQFKHILSLVPAVYARDFESVETKGKLALDVFARGKMVGESYPAFGVNLGITDAMFHYPDLPKSVDDIQIAVNVKSPGGDLDNTIVDVSKFHLNIAENPFDMSVYVSTPMSDPFLKAAFDGSLDLGSIKDVVPLEQGEELNGLIKMAIRMEGNESTIEKEAYEEFDAEGNLNITNMVYKSGELGYPVLIEVADVDFSPRYVTLNSFKTMLGKSDIQASGKVEQFVPYVFDKGALVAVLDVNSKMMDINELMGPEEASTEEEGGESEGASDGEAASENPTEEPPLVVEPIPDNIDFEMNSNIALMLFDTYKIEDIQGNIVVRNQKVSMNNAGLRMLGGKIISNGYYETTNPENPTFSFDLDVQKLDVKQTTTTFNTVEKLAPLFKSAEGAYSTKMNIVGTLDKHYEPLEKTLNGGGNLTTHGVIVKDFAPLVKLSEKLKRDDIKEPKLDDVKITFEIIEGKVHVQPFDVKTGNITSTIYGWNALDQTLEYHMNIAVPSSEFGGAANQAAQTVLDMFKDKTGASVDLPEIVNIKAKITGTVDEPKISLDFPSGGDGGNAKDEMKKKLEEELAKKKKELEAKAKAEAEKLKKEAEAKARAEADKLKKEAEARAKAEAEKAKKEAEAKAKAEAERLKKKAEEEAKKKAEEEAKKNLKNLFK